MIPFIPALLCVGPHYGPLSTPEREGATPYVQCKRQGILHRSQQPLVGNMLKGGTPVLMIPCTPHS